MIVIGITGSIGMGKSTASKMLQDMGIPVFDVDAAVHRMLAAGGSAVSVAGKKFPEALKIDNTGAFYIDRRILGRIVFADPHRKKELEDALHPLVWEESDRFISDMEDQGFPAVVLDVPLLFETGSERRVDVAVCVSASPNTQRQRVLARPGMTAETFTRIVAGQLPDAEKRQRADYVVETDKGLDDTRRQLEKLVGNILPPSPKTPKNHPPRRSP